MKNAPVMLASWSGAEIEALIKEARRRQRRRRAATAGAVATVLAAALGVFTGLHGAGGPRRPGQPGPGPAASHPARPQVPGPIPASIGTAVLMWPAGGQAGGIDRRATCVPAGSCGRCRPSTPASTSRSWRLAAGSSTS